MTFERWCSRCADDESLFGLVGLLLAIVFLVLVLAPYEWVKERRR